MLSLSYGRKEALRSVVVMRRKAALNPLCSITGALPSLSSLDVHHHTMLWKETANSIANTCFLLEFDAAVCFLPL